MTTTPAASFGAKLHQVDGSTALGHSGTQACWLCGSQLPTRSMVPDGGSACADVRWYCADTASCTQRWTKRQPSLPLPSGGYRRAAGSSVSPT